MEEYRVYISEFGEFQEYIMSVVGIMLYEMPKNALHLEMSEWAMR